MSKVYGCGDHGCIFGHPGGMGTNGGCRCLDLHRNPDKRIRAMKNIQALRTELDAKCREVERLRELLSEADDCVASCCGCIQQSGTGLQDRIDAALAEVKHE